MVARRAAAVLECCDRAIALAARARPSWYSLAGGTRAAAAAVRKDGRFSMSTSTLLHPDIRCQGDSSTMPRAYDLEVEGIRSGSPFFAHSGSGSWQWIAVKQPYSFSLPTKELYRHWPKPSPKELIILARALDTRTLGARGVLMRPRRLTPEEVACIPRCASYLLHQAPSERLYEWRRTERLAGPEHAVERPSGLVRIAHAFRLVTRLYAAAPEHATDWDKRAVRRCFLALQDSAAQLGEVSPAHLVASLQPFALASTLELAEKCDVDVDLLLARLNNKATFRLMQHWRNLSYRSGDTSIICFDEFIFLAATDVLCAWSGIAEAGASILHPAKNVVQVNRVIASFAECLVRYVRGVDLEAEDSSDPAVAHRCRMENCLLRCMISWQNMSEVYDALPEEAAVMLVGPRDLAMVTDAYLRLSERSYVKQSEDVIYREEIQRERATFTVKTLSLWGKVMTGYFSKAYKDIYLDPEKMSRHKSVTKSLFHRRGVVRDMTRRMVLLSDYMSPANAAEVNFALGSMMLSGADVEPDAIATVSRAARRLAPEMDAAAVTQAMWGYARFKSREGEARFRHRVGAACRRDYEAVLEQAGAVAETMTAAQVARVIRCWGDMVTPKRRKRKVKRTRCEARGDGRREEETEREDVEEGNKAESGECEVELSTDGDEDMDDIDGDNDDDDVCWTPPTREALQSRLDALSAATLRTASDLDSTDLKNLLKGWAALVKHHPAELTLDPAAVKAATDEAARVTPDVKWTAIGQMDAALEFIAEIQGMEIDPEARVAVKAAAALANTRFRAIVEASKLHALGNMAAGGELLDPAEVAQRSDAVAAVALHLGGDQIAAVMRSWARLATHAGIFVDEEALRAVSTAVGHPEGSALELDLEDMDTVEEAIRDMETAAKTNNARMTSNRMSKQPEAAAADAGGGAGDGGGGGLDAFHAEKERWIMSLPAGKRTKLEAALEAAASFEREVELVMASAEGDSTKTRAAARLALLEAAAGMKKD